MRFTLRKKILISALLSVFLLILISISSFDAAINLFNSPAAIIFMRVIVIFTSIVIIISNIIIYKENNKNIEIVNDLQIDITGRKKTLQKFSDLLDSFPIATVIVDQNGEIKIINRQTEKLFYYSRNELLGQNVKLLLPAEVINVRNGNVEEFTSERFFSSVNPGIRIEGKRKDGTLFPAGLSVSSINTDDGELIATSIRDISEIVNNEENLLNLNRLLESSNSELESFSYSVSHDLRTPLRHIIGFGEKLKRTATGHIDSEEQRLINKMTSSAGKMSMLINDLLLLSRVGKTEIEKRNINLQNIAEQTIEEFKNFKGNENITWIPGELGEINADPVQLGVVFTNLIANAVKYTGKKEKRIIELGKEVNGNENIYSIKDNGAGFDMKYSSKLFGIFQRLHGENEYEGTGIGLAIVKRIISRHGGRVWAKGEINKGAEIYFSLPNK